MSDARKKTVSGANKSGPSNASAESALESGKKSSTLKDFCGLSDRQSAIVAWGITSLAICAIAGLATLVAILGNSVIRLLAPAITPLVIGWFLSLVFTVPYSSFCNFAKTRKFCYWLGWAAVIIGIGFLLKIGAGALADQIDDLIANADDIWQKIMTSYPRIGEWGKHAGVEFLQGYYKQFLKAFAVGLQQLSKISTWGFAIFFCYCFLESNWSGKDIANKLISASHIDIAETTRKQVGEFTEEFRKKMTEYFPIQLLINVFEGSLGAMLLAILNIPYGLCIGFLMGFLNIIPLFGTFAMLPIVLLVAYCSECACGGGGRNSVICAVCAWGIVEGFDLVVPPKIHSIFSGKGLPAWGIVFSFLLWGAIIDPIWGMILAVPLSAFFHEIHVRFKHNSHDDKGEGADDDKGSSDNSDGDDTNDNYMRRVVNCLKRICNRIRLRFCPQRKVVMSQRTVVMTFVWVSCAFMFLAGTFTWLKHLRDTDFKYHYQLACECEREGQASKAVDHLIRAIECGLDPTKPKKDNSHTPIFWDIFLKGNPAQVKKALKSPHSLIELANTEFQDGTILSKIIRNDNLANYKAMKEKGVNKIEGGKILHLFYASGCGSTNIVRWLVRDAPESKRESVNELDEYGWSPLMLAATKGNREVCQILVDNGADVFHKIGINDVMIDPSVNTNAVTRTYIEGQRRIRPRRLPIQSEKESHNDEYRKTIAIPRVSSEEPSNIGQERKNVDEAAADGLTDTVLSPVGAQSKTSSAQPNDSTWDGAGFDWTKMTTENFPRCWPILLATTREQLEKALGHTNVVFLANNCEVNGQTILSAIIQKDELGKYKAMTENGVVKIHGGSLRHLFYASACGSTNIVRWLLRRDAPARTKETVDEEDERGWTPLIHAVAKGQLDMCKLLVENGADVMRMVGDKDIMVRSEMPFRTRQYIIAERQNAETPDGQYVLACRHQNLGNTNEMIEHLVQAGERGYDLTRTRSDGMPNFRDVFLAGTSNQVDRLFDIERINQELTDAANEMEYAGKTILAEIIQTDNLERYKTMTEKGVNKIQGGETRHLFYAALKNCTNIAAHLVKDGIEDVNERDAKNWTPLMYAAKGGHLRLCKDLIDWGADVYCKAGTNEDILTDKNYTTKPNIRYYIEAMRELNECQRRYREPNYKREIIERLIDKGVDVDYRWNFKTHGQKLYGADKGWTFLRWAVVNNETNLVRYLVDQGSKVNEDYQRQDGMLPLEYAVKNFAKKKNDFGVVNALLGADDVGTDRFNVEDNRLYVAGAITALKYSKHELQKLKRLLLVKGSDGKLLDLKPVLFSAAKYSNTNAVEILLEQIPQEARQDLLDAALKEADEKVREILERASR